MHGLVHGQVVAANFAVMCEQVVATDSIVRCGRLGSAGSIVKCEQLGSAIEGAFIAVGVVVLCVVEAAVVGSTGAAAESTTIRFAVVELTNGSVSQFTEHETATVVFVTVSLATGSAECPIE